mmetsp:Transcript_18182/g.23937  ORF Transcript_18182/g.23937 Transcript_18182/m.23937 type:complete len:224 (+) Transcript_18182:130-801(+)|eukprot:CAMPEP_0117758764 /NCGR_PEP_ID=MMETSP0947-20121206/15602_1 /TAXON_ID=44440 /ORGANISM="Chattonella subsalsa, Strain CCMP2191" /LENGTH=223 /DNA_ID=CAMNT_0005579073 /DNA_START=84 /DNA_END=755 /DNA_ORIENTATION=+
MDESKDDSKVEVKKDDTVKVVDEEDLTEDHKGYKNGLPYFHRELSEQDKALIGDISPQQIPKTLAEASGSEVFRQGSSSAWNAAQTWEEKDCTEWAKRRLKELLMPLEVEAPNNVTVEVTQVESLTGDAHIAVVRGRPRYIWDFAVTLKFTAHIGEAETKGELIYQEIGYDCDGEYEVEISYKSGRPSGQNHTLLRNVIAKNEFNEALCERIEVFKNEFHEKK